jgi:hypothetical protein
MKITLQFEAIWKHGNPIQDGFSRPREGDYPVSSSAGK